jgi:hypothetical protein
MGKEEVIIDSYSRQQAIADGVLVDVTKEAQEAGFKIPVAITKGVHALCQVPENLKGVQDYKGRLWDTLYMATVAYKKWKRNPGGNDGRIIPFKVMFLERNLKHKTYDLWLVFNEYEGFTIMTPSEY